MDQTKPATSFGVLWVNFQNLYILGCHLVPIGKAALMIGTPGPRLS